MAASRMRLERSQAVVPRSGSGRGAQGCRDDDAEAASTENKPQAGDGSALTLRIAPGSAAHSGIVARMSARGSKDQMPPLGTELVDAVGVAQVSAWIASLSPAQCAPDSCVVTTATP